jgi:hypothetical protein
MVMETPGKPPPVTFLSATRDAKSLHEKASVAASAPNGVVSHALSPDERAAAGKALREKVARAQHAAWRKWEGRPDPIAVLQAADQDRWPELVPIR